MKEVGQQFPDVKSGTQPCLSGGGGAQLISAQMILVSVTLIIETNRMISDHFPSSCIVQVVSYWSPDFWQVQWARQGSSSINRVTGSPIL